MADEVRPPKERELAGVFACLRTYGFRLLGSAGPVADPDFSNDAVLSLRNRLTYVDLEDKCFVATSGGEVAGLCCWAWLDERRGIAKTVLICVLPELRNRGFGALLQERRMRDMRERGARELHTWSVDPRAVDWYERRFGYRAVGVEPVRHALHRWNWRDQVFWGIHRGYLGRDEMTHLVADLEPPVA